MELRPEVRLVRRPVVGLWAWQSRKYAVGKPPFTRPLRLWTSSASLPMYCVGELKSANTHRLPHGTAPERFSRVSTFSKLKVFCDPDLCWPRYVKDYESNRVGSLW